MAKVPIKYSGCFALNEVLPEVDVKVPVRHLDLPVLVRALFHPTNHLLGELSVFIARKGIRRDEERYFITAGEGGRESGKGGVREGGRERKDRPE